MTKLIAEIGVNHGGDIERALRLIRMAAEAGADYVKFQKRTPEVSTPKSQWDIEKQTPWGTVERYIEYRAKAEFWSKEYDQIDRECADFGIGWFASVWDKESVEFLSAYDIPFIKIPSALANNTELIEYAADRRGVLVSTGMCEQADVDKVSELLRHNLGDGLFVCHSQYPVADERELNLRQIESYKQRYPGLKIGFSCHSPSPYPAIYASVLNAEFVEVHITENRAWTWGDNSASLESAGLALVAREIKRVKNIMGDGVKRLYPGELAARLKLRGY